MISQELTPQKAADIASKNISVKIPDFSNLQARCMGYCDVDAGMIYLGDPCYFISDADKNNLSRMSWHDFLDKYIFTEEFTSEIPHAMGHKGMGVVVDTYYGDGSYPVIGFFKQNEIRPLFVTIDFNGEFLSEDEEDE